MKFVTKIATLFLMLCTVSCRNSSAIFTRDEMVARVGKKELTQSMLASVVPSGLSGDDSVNYVEAYVEKWVVKQLKLQEAELMFSASAADIDRMVEEYRQSLLIRKIEQYYLDTEMRTDVTDDDVAAYYESHSGEFRLTRPIVKGRIVEIGDNYRRRESLLKLMASAKVEDDKDFEELCRKHNLRLTRFDEWVDYNEFLSNLPVLRTERNEGYLAKRGIQQIHYDKTYYCFQITDARAEGERMPLFMAQESIRRILLNQRQGEVLHSREEMMKKNAVESGMAKISASLRQEENNEKE